MVTATLSCGTVLGYEAYTFRPSPGEWVPCRHHGYCVVAGVAGRRTTDMRIATSKRGVPESTTRSRSGGPSRRRARPRPDSDLRDWLRGRSATTIHVLRKNGFTLRALAVAQRQGLIGLDLVTGRVIVCR